jgi:Trk-type K+ transport system membrane component
MVIAMTRRPSANAPTKLSLMLRRSTKTMHDVTEQRFLALSGADGSGMLANLASLNRALVFWLHPQTALALPRGVAETWEGYARALHAHEVEPDTMLAMRFRLNSVAETIGAIYVACGATLGVSLIRREMAAPENPASASETAFFEVAQATARRWRDLRGAIDLWGMSRGASWDACVSGANTSFCVALTIMGSLERGQMTTGSAAADLRAGEGA